MGKRSSFVRRKHDAYRTTDLRAAEALLPHLGDLRTYAEPCCGDGDLVVQLASHGLTCLYANDITDGVGVDALDITDFGPTEMIITNPPWTRSLLHPLIRHFQQHRPTWLLFDADWMHNAHAAPYLDQCSDIVAVGRLRWIEGTKQTGKDNVCWYRFSAWHSGGPRFHNGRTPHHVARRADRRRSGAVGLLALSGPRRALSF